MKRGMFFLCVLVFCLFAGSVFAATGWTWEDFVGTTHWTVDKTDDERGCGGRVFLKSYYDVVLTHNREIIDASELGHGYVRGTITGNTLHLIGRTIDDSGGKSKLDAADIVFSPDCRHFSGKYGWVYTSRYQNCGGTTQIEGTRSLEEPGCPAIKVQREEIAAARAAMAGKEAKYKEILSKDPDNFWANWDMAELMKKEKRYNEYLDYVGKAASLDNVKEVREELKQNAAESLHLSRFPTRATSPILRFEMDELKNWQGGRIYNVDFSKKDYGFEDVKSLFWSIFDKASDALLNKAAYDTGN